MKKRLIVDRNTQVQVVLLLFNCLMYPYRNGVLFSESQFGNVLCTRTCSSCHNCETCVVINLVFHLKRGHCSAETRSRIIMSLTCKHGIVRLSGSISIRRGIAVIRVTFSIAGGYLPSIQPDLWILREVGC